MSYIVVYQRADGSSGAEECADLDLAVVAAERLRNVDSVERPRIFKTAEITYDFRPYYRVEVTGPALEPELTQPSPWPSAVAPTVVPDAEPSLTHATVEDVFGTAPAPVPVEVDPIQAESISVEPEILDEEPAAEAIVADDPAPEPAPDPPADVESASVSKGLFSPHSVPEPTQDFPAVTQIADEEDDVPPPRRGLFGR